MLLPHLGPLIHAAAPFMHLGTALQLDGFQLGAAGARVVLAQCGFSRGSLVVVFLPCWAEMWSAVGLV